MSVHGQKLRMSLVDGQKVTLLLHNFDNVLVFVSVALVNCFYRNLGQTQHARKLVLIGL